MGWPGWATPVPAAAATSRQHRYGGSVVNAAILLISTAWLAGGDPVVTCGCGCTGGACATCDSGCGCDCGCNCGCNCGCCECRPPGLIRRVLLALRRPDCCGCCGCCGCGCECRPVGVIQRVLRALPRPTCCGCDCGCDCGCGCADGGCAASAHGAPAHGTPATPLPAAPEKIAPPKEPAKDTKPMGVLTPGMETAPIVSPNAEVNEGISPF